MLRAVVRDGRMFGEHSAELVARPLVGELMEAIVLDTPASVSYLRKDSVARIGRREDEWFADARERTRAALELQSHPLELKNVPGATEHVGDHASSLLALDDDDADALWIVPQRSHAVHCAPRDGAHAAVAAVVLGMAARGIAAESPEPLSPEVYAPVGGAWRVVHFGTAGHASAAIDSSGDLLRLGADWDASATLDATAAS